MNPGLIARFNPYQMAEQEIRALSVGRENLLRDVLRVINENTSQPKLANEHILLTGQRGMGKSFFLRLLQLELQQNNQAQLILLPEEQPNLFSPANFIYEIIGLLDSEQLQDNNIAFWETPEDNTWQIALDQLESVLQQQLPDRLLVVAIENFDIAIKQAFNSPAEQSALRHFLEHNPSIMLIATSLFDEVDEQYDQRLFQVFSRFPVLAWNQDQHVAYLKQRAQLAGLPFDDEAGHKIRAYSHFTGGSPRIAMVLADLLLGQSDVLNTAINLQSLVDTLTDYYLDLLSRIPANSRKLFDALLRGGEPCSQSAVAERVRANQSQTSRAFAWLRDHGYIHQETKIRGQKEKLYRVNDRVMVQFYRMRYLNHNKSHSALVSMSDFLSDFYNVQEQRDQAQQLMREGAEQEAGFFAELALKQSGIDLQALEIELSTKELIILMQSAATTEKTRPVESSKLLDTYTNKLLDAYTNDETALQDYEEALKLLQVCNKFPDISGKQLANLTENSILPFGEKLRIYRFCISDAAALGHWKNIKTVLVDAQKTFLQCALENPQYVAKFKNDRALEQMHPVCFNQAKQYETKAQEKENINQWQEALELYKKAFRLREKLGDTIQQGWNLIQIGSILGKLNRHQEAIKFFQQSLVLWEQEDIFGQGFNLIIIKFIQVCIEKNANIIGLELKLLGHYQEAIEFHQQELALRKQEDNINGQAENLEQIGWNLNKLERHQEAIEAYQQALVLRKQQDDVNGQAWNLEQVGWSLNELERHQEAIEFHQQALVLRKYQDNVNGQAWNLGQIARCHWSMGNPAQAWTLIDEFQPSTDQQKARERALKQLGDAIADCTARDGIAAGFAHGITLFNGLHQRQQHFDIERAVRLLLLDFLEMKLDAGLLRDLCAEANVIFGGAVETVTQSVRFTLDYLENGKDAAWLQRLDPDMATTVKTLASDALR